MPHTLIAGISRSGKTFLAKALVAELYRTHWIVVCDPKLESGWKAHKVFDNGPECAAWVKQALRSGLTLGRNASGKPILPRGMVVLWEEAKDATCIGLNPCPDVRWCFLQGAGFGLRNIISSQRIIGVSPDCRNQCDNAFLFQVNARDAAEVAEHLNDRDLLQASTIEKYHFLRKVPFAPVRKDTLKL